MTSPVPEEVNEGAPPALFDHCVNTYRAMQQASKPVETFVAKGRPDEDSIDTRLRMHEEGEEDTSSMIMVYEGFFTQLVTSQLNLSVPYFTSVRKALINMGCIRQLKRGGGTSPSQWELIYEPTLEAFMNQQPKREKKPTKDVVMQEQIDRLNSRVADLEGQMETILEGLATQFGTTPKEEE
jgi:hypothetical protein